MLLIALIGTSLAEMLRTCHIIAVAMPLLLHWSARADDLPAETPGAESLSVLRIIALDPGHGGSNEGALGVAGIYERFLTLETGGRLRRELLRRFPDIEVVLTRSSDEDVGLSERTMIANVAEADLFLSIHYNAAANPLANGIEVFYLRVSDEDPEPPWPPDRPVVGPAGLLVASILADMTESRMHGLSTELASIILDALVEGTGAADRGVRRGAFRVLRGAHMPAVVVELGFLTHAEEGQRLVDTAYTDLLVESLCDGIIAYDAFLGSSAE